MPGWSEKRIYLKLQIDMQLKFELILTLPNLTGHTHQNKIVAPPLVIKKNRDKPIRLHLKCFQCKLCMYIDSEVCGRIYCKETSLSFKLVYQTLHWLIQTGFKLKLVWLHFVQTKNQSQKLSKLHQRINSILKVFWQMYLHTAHTFL
jgi:hypothetical protein